MSQRNSRPTPQLETEPSFTLPHSTEFERKILGTLFVAVRSEESIGEFERITEMISPEAFYWPQYGDAFAAMRDLHHRKAPVEPASVADEILRSGKVDLTNFPAMRQHMTELAQKGAKLGEDANMALGFYADRIRDLAKERELLIAAGDITGIVFSPHLETAEKVAQAEKRIQAAASAGGLDTVDTALSLRDLMRVEGEELEQREHSGAALAGLSTGFTSLDKILLGLKEGELTILAGRPAMGKSAVGQAIALNVAKQGKSVAFFSIEMHAKMLTRRILSSESRVPLSKILTGQGLTTGDWKAYNAAENRMWDYALRIDATRTLYPSLLLSKARRLRSEMNALDLVVVDHFHLMSGEPGARYGGDTEKYTAIAQALQTVARELNCPVLCLAQLSRSVDKRDDKRPVMTDLRGSSAIEENADAIAFVYRPSYYERNEEGGEEEAPEPERDEIQILVEKNRNGETAYTKLDFLPHITRVEPWAPRETDTDWAKEY